MSLIDVINPDLSWMHAVHDPTAMLAGFSVQRPFNLPAGVLASLDGKEKYEIEGDFAVAIASVSPLDYSVCAAVAMRGQLAAPGGVEVVHHQAVYAWAAQTFFATHDLCAIQTMTLDALARSILDLPTPELQRCPRCRGRMGEPGAEVQVGAHATLMDGPDTRGCVSATACEMCGGGGRLFSLAKGELSLGPITVNRYALKNIAPHLRGNEVAICLAPSLAGDGLDCHVRPYFRNDKDHAVGGEWRLLWPACQPEGAAVAPLVVPAA